MLKTIATGFYTAREARKFDFITPAILILLATVIYFPVYHADYLYTDEAVQVWLTDKNVNLTSVSQGRYITYIIFKTVFGHIHSVHAVRHARIISLLGWYVSLPVWYFIIKRLLIKNQLPKILAAFSCGYLVCMPSFAISVGWSACLEMFLACTAALVAGYTADIGLNGIKQKDPMVLVWFAGSAMSAMISLFTYQNGFGCYFFPAFIILLRQKRLTNKFLFHIVGAVILYMGYYLLFRYSLHAMSVQPDGRTEWTQNPFQKLMFFFKRPVMSSFHYTWLFDEKSGVAVVSYLSVLILLLFGILRQFKQQPFKRVMEYLGGIVVVFILAYLPSLIASENYASNRTLLSLNLLVFLLTTQTLFSFLASGMQNLLIAVLISAFAINAWWNFRFEFVRPLVFEYASIKNELLQKFTMKTDTIFFVRPSERGFISTFRTVGSWDEFGIPSTAKPWVPDPLIRQLVLEIAGSKLIAERLVILSFENEKMFLETGLQLSDKTILLSAAAQEYH